MCWKSSFGPAAVLDHIGILADHSLSLVSKILRLFRCLDHSCVFAEFRVVIQSLVAFKKSKCTWVSEFSLTNACSFGVCCALVRGWSPLRRKSSIICLGDVWFAAFMFGGYGAGKDGSECDFNRV